LPSSKREGRRRLALHSAAAISRGVLRFAVEMDRDSDFTFGVCVAARPGYLGNGAGSLENFTSGQGPPKFGLPLMADFHCFGKNEVLSRVAIISVSGESQGQLRSHYCGSSESFPSQVIRLVDLFVFARLKGVRALGQSCPFRRGAARINVDFKKMFGLYEQPFISHLPQPPLTTPLQTRPYKCGILAE